MREIVVRLQEQRQVELATSILESNGYKVSKKRKRLKENAENEYVHFGEKLTQQEYIEFIQSVLADPSEYGYNSSEYGYDYFDGAMFKRMLSLVKPHRNAVIYVDAMWEDDSDIDLEEIDDNGYEYIRKFSSPKLGSGLVYGNRDSYMDIVFFNDME